MDLSLIVRGNLPFGLLGGPVKFVPLHQRNQCGVISDHIIYPARLSMHGNRHSPIYFKVGDRRILKDNFRGILCFPLRIFRFQPALQAQIFFGPHPALLPYPPGDFMFNPYFLSLYPFSYPK